MVITYGSVESDQERQGRGPFPYVQYLREKIQNNNKYTHAFS